MVHRLEREQLLPRGIGDVFAFFSKARNLEYELPLGVLGELARAAVVGRDLDRIFDFRQDAVRRLLSGAEASPPTVRAATRAR
jgi:hypothetical protein